MIGVFGGTFDPIHFGHLRAVLEIQQALSLDPVLLIPCGQPPHRGAPLADAEHRWRMAQLAAAEYRYFRADDREIRRAGPSYMVDTLASVREENDGELPCLIVGMDAFAGFPGWHCWQSLTDHAHVVVMSRPGADMDFQPQLARWLASRQVADNAELETATGGRVWITQVSALDISGTAIRACFRDGQSARFLLPRSICEYIDEHRLYR